MKIRKYLALALAVSCMTVCQLPVLASAEDSSIQTVAAGEDTPLPAADADTQQNVVTTASALKSALENAQGTAEQPTVIILGSDVTLTSSLTVPAGAYVSLQSDDGTRTLTKGFSSNSNLVNVSGTLYLSNVIIDGNSSNAPDSGAAVSVVSTGTLYVEAGTVLQECSRGVYNMGTCYIRGGTICDNYTTAGGAGIYNIGKLYMESGLITGNQGSPKTSTDVKETYYGGGVYNVGYFRMSGGTISGNLAYSGGGVYSTGTFIMEETDGETAVIADNEAKNFSVNGAGTSDRRFTGSACGGGVYVASGTFTMSGGTISGNRANNQSTSSRGIQGSGSANASEVMDRTACMGDGGGVYVSNMGAVFTMTGGTITGNQARGNGSGNCIYKLVRQGGGVYLQGGLDEATGRTGASFRFFGGSITGNSASSGNGSGVYAGNFEYVVPEGARLASEVQTYTGAVTIEIGGSPVVEGNTTEDMFLAQDVLLQITRDLKEDSAFLKIHAEDVSENARLAVYDSEITPDEKDCVCFGTGARTPVLQDGTVVLVKTSLEQGYEMSLEQENYIYTGSAIEPAVLVRDADGNLLVRDTDYTVSYSNNIEANTSGTIPSVTVTGINDYNGSITKEFTISPKDLSLSESRIVAVENELTRGEITFTYDGTEKKPGASQIVLKDEETGLYLNRNDDFKITFENAVGPGTAYVVVTGTGNYTGRLLYGYKIIGTDKWVHNSTGWWYQYADGTWPANCWAKIDGKWYYFNRSGYMQTGWLKSGNAWYYLGTNGAMQTGWVKVGNIWYYMNGSGVMQTGWVKVGNNWYYMNGNGAMQTGWLQSGNSWYYLNGNGAMVTSTWIGNYYLKANGVMARSEWVDNGKYYVNQNGVWVPGA